MADGYDKNGYNSSDFKRNANQDDMEQDGEGVKLNEKAGEYMRELLSEKIKLDSSKYPISCRLIDAEVAKLQNTGRIPLREFKYVDVYREKPVKVVTKVLLPLKEFPKFNFVGKLLGPKGNTLKQLQEDTMCKMAVLGRGSMRDRQKEEEYRNSLDPKYAHLADELHLEISALAPPAEAHARIAYALAEAKKYILPDPTEMVRPGGPGAPPPPMRDVFERGLRPGGRPPPPRMPPMPPSRGGPPSKSKVISILDRARSAMESPYGYDDPYGMPDMPPVRGPPPRVAPPPEDYYGYERPHDRYYEEDYYKEEMASRDYKSATTRDVGTRRAAPPQRHFARASPYTRTSKEMYSAPKKQRGH